MNEIIDVYARSKIEAHEAVCAERYENINRNLRQVTTWLVTLVSALGAFMATVLLKMF